MRRLVLAAASVLVLALGFSGPAASAEAESAGAIVSVRGAWLVAKGAAAEVRLRITCEGNGVGPGVLRIDLRADRDTESLAHGELVNLRCDGEPHARVVPLAVTGGQSLSEGLWRIDYEVTDCLESEECFDLQGGVFRTLERAAFSRPSSDDVDADTDFVRSRVTSTGDLRVVYDFRCDREDSFTWWPFATVVSQVGPGGSLVRGSAQAPMDEGGVLMCGPEPRRLTYVVAAAGGDGFRSGPVYVDTTVGEWYENNIWATDRRVIRLAVPTP